MNECRVNTNLVASRPKQAKGSSNNRNGTRFTQNIDTCGATRTYVSVLYKLCLSYVTRWACVRIFDITYRIFDIAHPSALRTKCDRVDIFVT